MEAEKQVKFFHGCVAAAFAERDHSIMEVMLASTFCVFEFSMFCLVHGRRLGFYSYKKIKGSNSFDLVGSLNLETESQ